MDDFDVVLATAKLHAPKVSAILESADHQNDEDYPHAVYVELAELAVKLEQRVGVMLKAMHDGYHSGFCNGTCAICDAYKAAISPSNQVTSPK